MEKKILAISDAEFMQIVLDSADIAFSTAPKEVKVALKVFKSEFTESFSVFCVNIHKALFSDKYVIGTKGKTAEADKL